MVIAACRRFPIKNAFLPIAFLTIPAASAIIALTLMLPAAAFSTPRVLEEVAKVTLPDPTYVQNDPGAGRGSWQPCRSSGQRPDHHRRQSRDTAGKSTRFPDLPGGVSVQAPSGRKLGLRDPVGRAATRQSRRYRLLRHRGSHRRQRPGGSTPRAAYFRTDPDRLGERSYRRTPVLRQFRCRSEQWNDRGGPRRVQLGRPRSSQEQRRDLDAVRDCGGRGSGDLLRR